MINDPARSRSPTRLWRSRVTTRSPTRENIVNARANGMVVTTSWPFRKWKTKPGTKVPTKAAKTNHGHLARSGVGLASAPVDLSIAIASSAMALILDRLGPARKGAVLPVGGVVHLTPRGVFPSMSLAPLGGLM